MSRHLKKILFIFPIFLFGMVLFNSINVTAKEKEVAVYDSNQVDGYYFNSSARISITTKRSLDFAYEGIAKYRVISPEDEEGRRMVTKWITYEHAHNDLIDLEIEVNFDELYKEENGQILTDKYVEAYPFKIDSLAKGAYHIEIEFYEAMCLGFVPCFSVGKGRHNTMISVVRSTAQPVVNYRFNSEGELLAKTETDGIVAEAKLFYTNDLTSNFNKDTFFTNYDQADDKRDLTNIVKSSMRFEEKIPLLDGAGTRYDYAYIYVLDGNGKDTINVIDLKARLISDSGTDDLYNPNDNNETDRYGPTIIIALISVLAVTASLIVAQKISDRKKIY